MNKQKTIALIEHYLYAVAASAVAIYQGGNHDVKKVAWAAVVGVIGPVIAAINPKSLANTLENTTK
jgi:hypothetical protein